MVEQRQVLYRIRGAWEVMRERDYQTTPRDGYRAIHIVVRAQGRPVEVQVRTLWEDMWANASEALANNLDPEIKYGGGPSAARKVLDDASLLCAGLDATAARRLESDGTDDRNAPDLGGALMELLTAAATAMQLHALASIPSDTLPGEFEVALSDAQQRIVGDAIDALTRMFE